MKELLNCPNCGAPITGPQCEYCGTTFEEVKRQVGFYIPLDHILQKRKMEFQKARLEYMQAMQIAQINALSRFKF